jgi:hypothetical protein
MNKAMLEFGTGIWGRGEGSLFLFGFLGRAERGMRLHHMQCRNQQLGGFISFIVCLCGVCYENCKIQPELFYAGR